MIRLVSLHIPKTAGTSFRNILKAVYGEDKVMRVDIPLPSEPVSYKSVPPLPEELKAAEVLHGHFRFQDMAVLCGVPTSVPVITWLRDPVERVISNYFYLQKILRDTLCEEERGLNVLSKMERSLLEYAGAEINRNRISKFLEGLKLKDLLFVGVQEHFMEDLRDLGHLMKWENACQLHQNSSAEQKTFVDPGIKETIRNLNEADAALYEEALHLRHKRRERRVVNL